MDDDEEDEDEEGDGSDLKPNCWVGPNCDHRPIYAPCGEDERCTCENAGGIPGAPLVCVGDEEENVCNADL